MFVVHSDMQSYSVNSCKVITSSDDEYLITRIEKFHPPLCVINCYGEQRKTTKDLIEEKWKRLVKEMNAIRARNEFCLLAGDLNKLVSNDELGVPGNHPDISPGGKLLRTLLATEEWILVNGLGEEVVEGGPFTRIDPATGKLSCLDLFIASKELRPYIAKLIIDSKREMTVSRPTKKKGKHKNVFSDHYSGLLLLENLPRKKEIVQKKEIKWNFAKEGGWESYKDITEKPKKDMEENIENDEISVEEAFQRVKKMHEKIKYKAFGKVKIKSDFQSRGRTESLNQTSCQPKADYEEMERIAGEEIEEIRKLRKGRVGQIWEVRKRIIGGKRAAMVATAIVNPSNGKVVVSRTEIKEVTLNYCIETLKNNEPSEDFKNTIEEKKNRVKQLLDEHDGNFEATENTFNAMIDKFKKSGKKSYDFLTKAGKGFQTLIFKLCVKMFKEEIFPEEFEETILHMIHKSGRKEILSSNRFVHCKGVWARSAEGLVVEDGIKRPLLDGSSIYQVGGQPGHRPEEMVFVFKSLVAKRRMEKKVLVAQGLDVEKFFDKEMIEDGVLVCRKRGADPKAVRLWYKLNSNTRIKVKTGVGYTEFGKVGAVIGQGMIGGALVSQAVLDDAVSENFPPAGSLQIQYGAVPMAPLIYLDDIQNSAPGLDEAREASAIFDKLLKQRGLALNRDKTICLVFGSKKQKEKASEELKRNPMICGEFEVEEKQYEKWLGQVISVQGLDDSVVKTVEAREGKIKGACQEIAEIVNDWRSRVAGGMESALLLWEACVVPSLLAGAGTWVEMSATTTKKLNNIQLSFLRLVLQVGPGAPLASLLWDNSLLDMGLRIWREKLMLLFHIRSLEAKSLARITYEEQIHQQWPGLAREGDEICTELEIDSVHSSQLEKQAFRELVTKACHRINEKRLRYQAQGKEKCIKITSESYGKKEYLENKSISEVREMYKTRFGLLPFAGNYSHDARFRRTNWLCQCTTAREEERHLLSGKCEVYKDIRENYGDLKNDDDLVKFFREVLDRREQLEEAKRAVDI